MQKKKSDDSNSNKNTSPDKKSIKPAISLDLQSSTDADYIRFPNDDALPVQTAKFLFLITRATSKHIQNTLEGVDEKGWKILLQLYIASKAGEKLTLSDFLTSEKIISPVCIRYIRLMENRGFLQLTSQPGEELSLTHKGDQIVIEIIKKISNDISLP